MKLSRSSKNRTPKTTPSYASVERSANRSHLCGRRLEKALRQIEDLRSLTKPLNAEQREKLNKEQATRDQLRTIAAEQAADADAQVRAQADADADTADGADADADTDTDACTAPGESACEEVEEPAEEDFAPEPSPPPPLPRVARSEDERGSAQSHVVDEAVSPPSAPSAGEAADEWTVRVLGVVRVNSCEERSRSFDAQRSERGSSFDGNLHPKGLPLGLPKYPSCEKKLSQIRTSANNGEF